MTVNDVHPDSICNSDALRVVWKPTFFHHFTCQTLQFCSIYLLSVNTDYVFFLNFSSMTICEKVLESKLPIFTPEICSKNSQHRRTNKCGKHIVKFTFPILSCAWTDFNLGRPHNWSFFIIDLPCELAWCTADEEINRLYKDIQSVDVCLTKTPDVCFKIIWLYNIK